MSKFDIAVSVDQKSMNDASANVYSHVYPDIFKGSKSVPGSSEIPSCSLSS